MKTSGHKSSRRFLWFLLPAILVIVVGVPVCGSIYGLIVERNAQAHLKKGSALDVSGDLSAAASEYREAIRLDPNYAEARYDLAYDLFVQGDTQGAKAQFAQLVTRWTPNGLAAYPQAELPFKVIPKEVLIHPSTPDQNPVVLSVLEFGNGLGFGFRLNEAEMSSEDLSLDSRFRDVLSSRQGVIWVYFEDGLPTFAKFMSVMATLSTAEIKKPRLILAPSDGLKDEDPWASQVWGINAPNAP